MDQSTEEGEDAGGCIQVGVDGIGVNGQDKKGVNEEGQIKRS